MSSHHGEKSALVLFSVSDNVRENMLRRSRWALRKVVNEIQIHRHQGLLSQVHKSSPPPLNSILSGGSMKANQSEACVGNSPIDWHLYTANAKPMRFPMRYTKP